jgi:ribosome-binding protein aMBF1 (putative translation factor)
MKNTMKSPAHQVKLTPGQIKAARALVGWSAEELAQVTALGITTIRRAELAKAETTLTAANDLAVRRALETAGIEFIEENGGGPGVRLRKRAQSKK